MGRHGFVFLQGDTDILWGPINNLSFEKSGILVEKVVEKRRRRRRDGNTSMSVSLLF